MIVRMSHEHVDEMARLHCESLKGLLQRLGPPAARAYYTGAVRTDAAIGLVDVDGGAVRGFVLGSTNPVNLKRDVFRENRLATLAAVFRGIVRSPRSLVWLLRSFRGPDDGSYDADVPELTYLAVDAAFRSTGLGKALVEAFSLAMRSS